MFRELLALESTVFQQFSNLVRERIVVISYKLPRESSSIVVKRGRSKILLFFFLNEHQIQMINRPHAKKHCLRAAPRDLMKGGNIPQNFPLRYDTLNVSRVYQKMRCCHST